jgi:glycosyltransferase involved in cell wall biosynthesis
VKKKSDKPKVAIVMTAFNVSTVLPKTIEELPQGCSDEIFLIDDCSEDNTAEVAKELGLTVLSHETNRGYGGGQKTGYLECIRQDFDAVVLVHGDNQYDPSQAPLFVSKIVDENYDVVTGTRMIIGDVLSNGMPLWKYLPNRFLTALENMTFGTDLSDYHNGYRAYSVNFLRKVPLELLSEKFDFDTDIIIQAAIRGAKIGEIPHTTRYNDENSQMPFLKGVVYGLSILSTVAKYLLHKIGLMKRKMFEVSK